MEIKNGICIEKYPFHPAFYPELTIYILYLCDHFPQSEGKGKRMDYEIAPCFIAGE